MKNDSAGQPIEPLVIRIDPGEKPKLTIISTPVLFSSRPLIQKGILALSMATPRLTRYLSVQHTLSHLESHPIVIRTPAGIGSDRVRPLLGDWLRSKARRRLVYVILELLLMPLAAVVAILPGPNVVFYALFVLFYFHLKTLLHLRRIRIEKIGITIENTGG
jgi:hypothetical protein